MDFLTFIKNRILFPLLFVPNLLLAQGINKSAVKPNIVIIISDDHAYQAISAYGSKLAHTPNIDRIASAGLMFNRAYVTNSICGPSRATILTGKYSNKNGFKDNENAIFNGAQDSFIKQLHTSGYLTAWIGKWHLGSQPQGFDFWQVLPGQGEYYNPDFLMMDGSTKRFDGYVTNIVENVTEQWLNSRDTTKPFCLVIGHKATHRTWLPDTTDLGKFDNVHFPLPHDFYDKYESRKAAQVQDMTIEKTLRLGYDLKMFPDAETEDKEGAINRMSPAQRKKIDAYYKPIYNDLKAKNLSGNALTEWKYQRYMRDYLSTAEALDRNIGRTLDYLEQHHLGKNTIVIYLSDQGFYLGEHGWFDKRWMYEESFRTPMIIQYPGKIKPGTSSDDFVLNLDVAPTVLDAAGVAVPKDMQGQSMLPLFSQGKSPFRDAIYYHYYENGEHSVSPHFGIKTKRYKLIRFYKRVESWELFDLKTDPNETKNLYGNKGYEKITTGLQVRLKQLIDKYEDVDAAKLFSTPVTSDH